MTISRRSLLGTGAVGLGAATLASGVQTAAASAVGPTVNAVELGVAKESTNDQTVELQAAINFAIGQKTTLLLPGGRILAKGLEITGGLTISGVPGQTVIVPGTSDGAFMKAMRSAHVVLRDITIDAGENTVRYHGNDSRGRALFEADGVSGLILENCRFLNGVENGIVLRDTSGRITNCEVAHVGQAAIFANNSKGLSISHCHIHHCDNNGILVWQDERREDGTIVADNRIGPVDTKAGGSGQNGNGVNIYRAANVVVSGNRITDCAYSAVRSNSGSYCQIVNNSCSRLGEVAMYAEFAFEGAIIANNIIENAASGISITNFNDGGRLAICSGNIVRNLFVREGETDKRGTGIGVEADTLVTGNVVENAPVFGIVLGWAQYLRDVTASDNLVRNCTVGIGVSVTKGAGAALIANNQVSGAGETAIAGVDHDKVVIPDLNGPELFKRKNATFTGNLVS